MKQLYNHSSYSGQGLLRDFQIEGGGGGGWGANNFVHAAHIASAKLCRLGVQFRKTKT